MTPEVLVVDDNRSSSALLHDVLGAVGYTVTVAGTAEEALSLINPNTHELLYVSLYLQDLGSLELVRELRPIVPNAKIILVADGSDSMAQAEAQRLGIRGWLFRPLRPEDIIRSAAEALGEAVLANGK